MVRAIFHVVVIFNDWGEVAENGSEEFQQGFFAASGDINS